jgi:kumamolisin
VSIIFKKPAYQNLIAGTRRSPMGQNWLIGGQLVYALPGNFPGRNVPDISFNADPETGYIVYYTSEPSGVFGKEPGWGGTSFVGPQLNGVTALLGESLHSRIGLLNFPLYDLAFSKGGYKGESPSFHAIKDGDNWFYVGRNGYNLGAGLGTLDVANFAAALRGLF